jgi:hypothetical protein
VKIVHKPMECCGMLAADGFSWTDDDGRERRTTAEERQAYFERILEAQRDWLRSCALISLSSDQETVLKEARANGFEVIHEFYNPNSGNQVYLLVKSLWKTSGEYRKERELAAEAEEEN